MKTTNCSKCNKEIEDRDTFHMDYSDLVNPITGEIEVLGNDLCLNCYRQSARYLQKIEIYI